MQIVDLYNYMSNLPRYHFFSILSVGYLFYYLIEVVKRPFLAVKKGPFEGYLLKNVPTLDVKYWPTFWCFESRAQTVFASFIRSTIMPDIEYRREILRLKDGGEVALDWLEIGCADDAPVVVILPGLTGESQAEYIKCLATQANKNGIKCVVFNNRGLGGISLKTPRLYCAANCEDLSEVVNHVHNLYPNVKKGATGISMEFDSHFTSIHFGYGNVDNYYKHATLHNKLHKIKVPTLCLSAADDPFQPFDAIPIKAAEDSSHVAIVVTARGGHIGFLDGVWPGHKDQYMGRLFAQYFSAALFDKDGEFAETVEKLDLIVEAE
ncbi:CLUMA_CG009833, isoform A [Clunio marinus]|uniref:CLUMA_CG009833, isoform A n=1 Tax=Clunio marinus TaxID=568069 RepID=A0A1J1ID98_9DIPT|nr:CLUMA_CG009833, isoform A [Clunio marinus]